MLKSSGKTEKESANATFGQWLFPQTKAEAEENLRAALKSVEAKTKELHRLREQQG